jgi:hypothetical protein
MLSRAVRPGLVAILLATSAAHDAARSEEQLYFFRDERGVPHFSNVPVDSRYRRLPAGAQPGSPREPFPRTEGEGDAPLDPAAAPPGDDDTIEENVPEEGGPPDTGDESLPSADPREGR